MSSRGKLVTRKLGFRPCVRVVLSPRHQCIPCERRHKHFEREKSSSSESLNYRVSPECQNNPFFCPHPSCYMEPKRQGISRGSKIAWQTVASLREITLYVCFDNSSLRKLKSMHFFTFAYPTLKLNLFFNSQFFRQQEPPNICPPLGQIIFRRQCSSSKQREAQPSAQRTPGK